MIYFTADWHLSHKNIIKYCKRPFENISSMNETIISNHTNSLKSGDILYYLGDYGFGVIPVLNPHVYRIIYLKGNHDAGCFWSGMPETITFKAYGYKFHLSHHIDEYIENGKTYDIYLCGHVHDRWKFKKFGKSTVINVGVDVWSFCPVSIKEIIAWHRRVQNGQM